MKTELSKILSSLEDLKKSLTEIQLELCKICRKEKVKTETIVYFVEPTISKDDYD